MRGYFEWTGDKTPETPHFLHGDGLLSAAGLTWSMELPNGEQSRCFVVITREARDASGEVHDRMPAFLTSDTWDAWLTPEKLTGDRKTRSEARRPRGVRSPGGSSLPMTSDPAFAESRGFRALPCAPVRSIAGAFDQRPETLSGLGWDHDSTRIEIGGLGSDLPRRSRAKKILSLAQAFALI